MVPRLGLVTLHCFIALKLNYDRIVRKIKYIVVHCTAGPQHQTLESVQAHWRSLGWRSPGYHYMITAGGTVLTIATEDLITNGVKGFNRESIHIAYFGGVDFSGKPIDNRTFAQKASLKKLLTELKKKYPTATIQGHRDFSPDLDGDGKIEFNEWIKYCPCFDAKEEYSDLS